jgi:hypothetical protein
MPPIAHSRSSGSCRWAFTLNNYTEDEEQDIVTLFESDPRVKYGVVGRELAPDTGTPHLQGFFISYSPVRLTVAKKWISDRAHLEKARQSSAVNRTYCQKDGDFNEFGEFPDEQGKRSDIEAFKEWCTSLDHAPSQREIANEYPSLYLRYPRLTELCGHLRPIPQLLRGDSPLREWQQRLEQELSLDPDDRSINFYIDEEGGKGKSYFVRYYVSKNASKTQFLSVGKRDDLAYAVDETKTVFLFDLPRGAMEHFQYSVLEKLKDQLVFSAKYASKVKVLENPVHVVVFCNEPPDMTAMTFDRYKINNI